MSGQTGKQVKPVAAAAVGTSAASGLSLVSSDAKIKIVPFFPDKNWKPYQISQDPKYVWKPTNGRPIFVASATTIGGPVLDAMRKWDAGLKEKYQDGEDELVSQHLERMIVKFTAGEPIEMPTNRFAKDAIPAFLITIQGLKDHGIKFD